MCFVHDAVLSIADTRRPAALENEACCMRAGFHSQIRAVTGGFEIGDGRTVAPTIAREQLKVTDALLIAAVEIVCAWNAELLRAANDGFHQFAFVLDIRRPQRAIAAVRRACAATVVFRFDEIRKDAVPVPAGVTKLRPMVIVVALPANENQPVD